MLLTSCESCPPAIEVPVDWPAVPDPGELVVLEGETVSMPLDYYLALVRYFVAIERVREIVGETVKK